MHPETAQDAIVYSYKTTPMQTTIIPYLHQDKIGDALQSNDKGIVVAATGAGKSYTMGWDIQKRILAGESVIVVVAPRILLCQQLFESVESLLRAHTFQHMFVYSGEEIQREEEYLTSEQILDVSVTTFVPKIQEEKERADRNHLPLLIFTTYHSLERIIESGISVDTAYLDEVHNAVALKFSKDVRQLSLIANHLYSYTATLKKTDSAKGRGNNNEEVYGKIICEITAKELIDAGVIVPPKVNYLYSYINASDVDDVSLTRDIIKQAFEHYEEHHSHLNHKILFACNGTETIHKLHTETDLIKWASQNGIDIFLTTANYGDWVNGVRIKSRKEFLEKLQKCGEDPNRKMAVLHYSILSEGIDVPGLTGCVIFRNMNPITLTQTIGRVLRMLPVDRCSISEGITKAGDVDSYVKGYGLVSVPIHKDSGKDLEEAVSRIYNSLCGMGFPPEVILHEEDTKGKKVMTLPDDLQKIVKQKIKEVDAEWEWVYQKNLYFGNTNKENWTDFL
jgi:superfamily II DNA or RNA helicase